MKWVKDDGADHYPRGEKNGNESIKGAQTVTREVQKYGTSQRKMCRPLPKNWKSIK